MQLTNLTDQPLLLQQSGVDATAFNTTLPGGLFVLNPHESASYSMTFNPSRPGVYTNTLGLGPSKDYKLALVNLTAEAVSPFSLTPSTVTLGNQPLGTVGTRKVKLTNSYSQNITISAYSFDHYNPNFTVDFPKLPLTLNPRDSVQFTVTYKPTNTWGDYTNLLISLPHSSNGVLPLTGQGVQAAVLAVDSIALDFGGQLINTTSKSRTITVKSTTDLPLVVGSVSINNPAFNVEMPKLPVTLQKGQGFNLKVTFQPNQAQVYNSQLQINTDFGLSIGTVALSGEGSATTPLEPGPNTLDFGTVTVGETSKARKVSFTNKLNTKSLTVAKITFSYPTKVLTKDYSTSNLSQSLPIVLAPGQKFLVEVSFSPTIANNRDGYMVLLDPDGNEIGRVAVKGTGSY
ncbi:MAG TPA: choice-of-anchor D domain-containing protein [Chloroflexia bacterium]|nr:choice-of-anchor D domain-containing protein [Chloroflexia bacterium]